MQGAFGRWASVVLLLCAASEGRLFATDEPDENDPRPGLNATISDSRHSVTRIDRRLNFDWTDSAADSRIGEAFKAHWSGNLLVRQPGDHTFHASLSGRVKVLVDGKVVVDAFGDSIFYSGQAASLSAGDHQIEVTFELTPKEDAKLQLFWSSPNFTLEPLPADVLSHDPTALNDSSASLAESGRFLSDALRCSACHDGISELPTLNAPSLQRARDLSHENIVERLLSPQKANSDSMMPQFGFSKEQANHVAAFLHDVASKESVADEKNVKFMPADVDAGSKLLLTTGCAACHKLSQLPDKAVGASPYHGPDLANVAQRRSPKWLMKWLLSPKELNTDHRMPVFNLSDDERRQIVASLSQSSSAQVTEKSKQQPMDAASIAEGKKLVIAANCVACHKIPGIEAAAKKQVRPMIAMGLRGLNRGNSCVASNDIERPNPTTHQPRFSVFHFQQEQLAAWFNSINHDLRTATHFAKGELLLHRNGCLACHDRDQLKGLSKQTGSMEATRDDLRGQSQALIPPELTAVGDRLKEDYLLSAVAGEQTERRLPWLLVRMPKFAFSKEDRESIVRHVVAVDRIPDAADVARPELFEHLNPHHPSLASPGELLTGNQLIGAAGFNCIACHKAGTFEPRNVAMGTRGSDIMTMGQRIRPRYFMRWMQNPIRVVSGIEMPAIRKPVAGVLDDSLPQQIATMWKALADPRFSPPTVLSRYEQLVTVAPGQRPRVIRDVFTIGENAERNSIPRALAIGFNNGHNLLIDLDSLQLRQWTIGEFARQRTEGKSWFWDMAGVSVASDARNLFLCRLKSNDQPVTLARNAIFDQRRHGELLSYQIDGDRVSLRLRYYFDRAAGSDSASNVAKSPDDATLAEASRHTSITAWNDPSRVLATAIVNYTLQPADHTGDATGWTIDAVVDDCSDSSELLFDAWQPEESGNEIPWTTTVDSTDSAAESMVSLAKGGKARLSLLANVVPPSIVPVSPAQLTSSPDALSAVPGFTGQRLAFSTNIMPTAITWLADGRMAFTSLRGQVWLASDTDGDKIPDSMSLFAEGLAAPYGIQTDGDSLLVSHKPEVLRLRDSNGHGMADQFDVVASGWGFSDDYHDWTTGLVRDDSGNLFVGLGSDYSQKNRPADNDRWRGTVLKIDSTGNISPIAYSLRFPMGLAFDRDQHLFATDNQGNQNTFNEINHVIVGKHYGVPSRHETAKDYIPESPTLMLPHPWTRSVNSIVFLPDNFAVPELAGHGIGCEYDTRCLIRFTVQDVDGTLQGATYRFSRPDQPGGGANFVGPVASAIGPDGALYIGSIWDSGWQGGSNTGSIERIVPGESLPNGIREIRATSTGFEVSFFRPVDQIKAEDANHWSIQAYTRKWDGGYATADSDRHTLTPTQITVADNHKAVMIQAGPLKAGYVYEISIKQPLDESNEFWPAEGFYTLKAIPK